jgi:hypothetical protein
MTGLPKNLFNKIRQMIFQYTSSQGSNIAALQSDVSTLQSDVNTLQNDVSNIQNITPIKVYKAYVSQTGITEPNDTVLINTLSGTPIYTRTSDGDYLLTLIGEFPTFSKVLIRYNHENFAGLGIVFWNNADSIGIASETLAGVATDSIISGWLEIEIYP